MLDPRLSRRCATQSKIYSQVSFNMNNQLKHEKIDSTYSDALAMFQSIEREMLQKHLHLPLPVFEEMSSDMGIDSSSSKTASQRDTFANGIGRSGSDEHGYQKLSSFTTIFNEIGNEKNRCEGINELKEEVTKFTEGIMTKIANNAIAAASPGGNRKRERNLEQDSAERANTKSVPRKRYFATKGSDSVIASSQKKARFHIEKDSIGAQTNKSSVADSAKYGNEFRFSLNAPDENAENMFPSSVFSTNVNSNSADRSALKQEELSFTDSTAQQEMSKFYDVFSDFSNPNDRPEDLLCSLNNSKNLQKPNLSKLKMISDDGDHSISDKYITYTMKTGIRKFLLLLDKLLTILDHFPCNVKYNQQEYKEQIRVEKHMLYERIVSVISNLSSKFDADYERDSETYDAVLAKRCFTLLNKLCINNPKIDTITESMSDNIVDQLDELVKDQMKFVPSFRSKESRRQNKHEMQERPSLPTNPAAVAAPSFHHRTNPITFSLKPSRSMTSNFASKNQEPNSAARPGSKESSASRSKDSASKFGEKEMVFDVVSIPLPEECHPPQSQASDPIHGDSSSFLSPECKVGKLATFIASHTKISGNEGGGQENDVLGYGRQKRARAAGSVIGRKTKQKPKASKKGLQSFRSSMDKGKATQKQKRIPKKKRKAAKKSHSRSKKMRKMLSLSRYFNVLQKKLHQDNYYECRKNLLQYFCSQDKFKKIADAKSGQANLHSGLRQHISGKHIQNIREIFNQVDSIINGLCKDENNLRAVVLHSSSLSGLLMRLAKDIQHFQIRQQTVNIAQDLLKNLKKSSSQILKKGVANAKNLEQETVISAT